MSHLLQDELGEILHDALEGLSEGPMGRRWTGPGALVPCGRRQGPFASKRSPERLTRVFHARKGSGRGRAGQRAQTVGSEHRL